MLQFIFYLKTQETLIFFDLTSRSHVSGIGSRAVIVTIELPRMTYWSFGEEEEEEEREFVFVKAVRRGRGRKGKELLFSQLTTIPMSCFILSSTAPSSTMFMNWSKPRSVPVTARLALRATVEFF